MYNVFTNMLMDKKYLDYLFPIKRKYNIFIFIYMSVFIFLCTKIADSGQIWGAVFEAKFRRKNAVCSFSTHFSFFLQWNKILLLFDAFLFLCNKKTGIAPFRRISLFFPKKHGKAPFRRISPEKLLFDAFLQKNSFSTHFSTKNTFWIILQTNQIFRRFSFLKHLVDAFLKPKHIGSFPW